MMATPPTSRTPTPTATTAPAHPSTYSDTYYQLPRTPTSTSFKSSNTSARLPRRQSQSQSHALQKIDRKVESGDVVQGRILWLPSKEDLPERAVRRAHGKGAIEEGIYNHPVVVVSRPAEGNEGEAGCVHFCLITSFQGKRLHEIYNKANEFHASRRSWYLPISPTPSHPDASSKKSRKRFPTLDLANNATLRWDSYVNIRHVYKLDWSYLKPYANPNTPENQVFRFERDSLVQLLAKSRVLTLYEPGPQFQNGNGGLNSNSNSRQNTTVSIPRGYSSPTASATTSPILERGYDRTGRPGAHDQFPQSPVSDTASIADSEYSATSALLQSDFSDSKSTHERSPGPPRKAPPDRNRGHGQIHTQNQNQEPDEGVVSRGIARQDSCSSVEEGADCGCIGYVIKRLLCCRPGGHGQP